MNLIKLLRNYKFSYKFRSGFLKFKYIQFVSTQEA